jgi:hypothetical protein
MDIEEYSTKNRYNERPVRFRKNDYLIRTKFSQCIRESDPISDSYFNNLAARFKKITESYSPTDEYFGKSITCDSVYYSGLYYRMYEQDKAKPIWKTDYKTISEISRIKEDQILGLNFFYNDYLKWRSYFYGKKI